MNTAECITAIIIFLLAGFLMFVSIRHFVEKGFLFNNAYLYATKEQREQMNKKPYYRQSAIVFCVLSLVFIILGLSIVFQNYKIELFEIPLIIGVLIYAIVSTIHIQKHKDK